MLNCECPKDRCTNAEEKELQKIVSKPEPEIMNSLVIMSVVREADCRTEGHVVRGLVNDDLLGCLVFCGDF